MTVIVETTNLPKICVETIFILQLPPIAIDPKFKDRRIVGRNPPRAIHTQKFCN